MATNLAVSVKLSLKDKLTRPLKSMGAGFKKMNRTLKASQSRFAKLNAQMKTAGARSVKMGKSLSRKVTLPLLALGGAAIKTGMDFNKGMANVATLIPGNTKRIKELGDNMLKLSTQTGTSTKDLTDGLYQVVSAFGDTGDTADKMQVAVKAATAGVASTTDAINLLSAVTKGYGDTSAAALKTTSDLAFTTVKLGQTTFPELASNMGRVVPIAATLNVSQKELFGTFATLTGVTGNTAEVSTQLSGVLGALLKPTTDMTKAAKALGFQSSAQMIKQKGLAATLQLLQKHTKGSETAVAKLFGRKEAMNAFFALTGKQATTYATKLNAMNKTLGATDTAFDAQTKGVNKAGFQWKKFLATTKVLAINIGRMLLPIMASLANVLSKVFGFITNLPAPVKGVIIALAGLAAIAGPVLFLAGSFLKLRKAFKMVKLSFGIMAKSMRMNPVFLKLTLLVGAIAAIVAIFKKSTINIKENQRVSQDLETTVTKLAKAYDKTGKAAGKLTAEQKAQMTLKMLDANEKSLSQMAENYTKIAQLTMEVNATEAGTKEHVAARAKLTMMMAAQGQAKSAFTRSQKFLGRGKSETQAALSGIGTGVERKVVTGEIGQATLAYAKSGKTAADYAGNMIQKAMLMIANPQKLQGQVFIHIKSDGTATSTAAFPGSKIGTKVSAQSVKNGRTRK